MNGVPNETVELECRFFLMGIRAEKKISMELPLRPPYFMPFGRLCALQLLLVSSCHHWKLKRLHLVNILSTGHLGAAAKSLIRQLEESLETFDDHTWALWQRQTLPVVCWELDALEKCPWITWLTATIRETTCQCHRIPFDCYRCWRHSNCTKLWKR